MNTLQKVKQEIKKGIVGQDKMIDSLLIGLLCDGHILLEGLPGLAKTTTVNTFAKVLGLEFKRVQFTPDLLPSDIIGSEVYDLKSSEFKIKKGPIFTNILLADEINRAPAKVQSALLEAMAERQVTIADSTYILEEPFLTLATQNPIEQEGAYNLPEAQLDRFMLKIEVQYNTKEEEKEIINLVTSKKKPTIKKVISKRSLQTLKNKVQKVHMDEELKDYIVDIVDFTRNPTKEIKKYIDFGASPRASIALYKASKAKAFLEQRDYVTPVDIALITKDVLRHRIVLSYDAISEELNADNIIDRVLEEIPLP